MTYPQFNQGENKLTASLLNRIMRMLQWYEGQWRTLEIKKPERYERRDRPGFWAIVIGAELESDNRWRYLWVEAEKSQAGYGSWSPKPDGRQGISGDERAFNLLEDKNDGAGLEGNGVNVDTLPGSFTLRQVPSQAVVRMWTVGAPGLEPEDPRLIEYWFSFANAIDGQC